MEYKKNIDFELHRTDDDRRLAVAWASVVTRPDGDLIVDGDDDIILIEDLEEAFINSFMDGGLGKGGELHGHEGGEIGSADVVQFFTLSKEERDALGFGNGPEGAIVKFRVNDDDLWEKIKAGYLPEVSLGMEMLREKIDA